MSAAGQFILDVPGEPRYVSTARLFAVAICRQLQCDEDTIEDLKLAISEALSSKIGKASGSPRMVRVAMQPDGRDMVVSVAESPLDGHAPSGAPDDMSDELALALIRGLFPDVEIVPDSLGAPIRFRLSAPSGV